MTVLKLLSLTGCGVLSFLLLAVLTMMYLVVTSHGSGEAEGRRR
ncbi:MAG TPA: hypothetical protein VM802_16235 [Chitinophaga sp.]|nr:hypothetical protein [Chitinophaga sp.]HVI46425.1 hypothetical protein [Chitinophaga sp.]